MLYHRFSIQGGSPAMTHPVDNAEFIPAVLSEVPSPEQIASTFEPMILSASGWRKIFAADGEEHSSTHEISDADKVILSTAARIFSRFMRRRYPDSSLLLAATDSRPTGAAAAQVMIRTLLHEGWEVRYLGITAVPEVIAYNMMDSEIHGGIYISASHNPLGHNGLKFFASAGVIGGEEAAELIHEMKDEMQQPSVSETAASVLSAVPFHAFSALLKEKDNFKLHSADAYRQFISLTASDSRCLCGQDSLYNRIREAVQEYPLSVVIDFNGSARTTSIDIELLNSLGIRVSAINTIPGKVAHGIIPEGENLEPCRRALEEAYASDPSFSVGYVPDNDGDRGNIVYIEESSGKALTLEAQEVFSLVYMAESAYLHTREQAENVNTAAAVNCATSMRIEDIAEVFGAQVFRAEVGEANVVSLARKLRESGYTVRVLGEGSNGGNITHPSVVRDPLNTLLSVIKLLALRDTPSEQGLFHTWHTLSGADTPYCESFSLVDILATLPQYRTTNTSEPRALLKIPCSNQGAFKEQYEQCFLKAWEQDRPLLKERFGITSWREFNTEGIESQEGMGAAFRSEAASGGLRIVFYDEKDRPTDFIWMRKSGTEPVFRILADSRGDDADREAWLLEWHRSLISQAVKY